MSNGATPAPTKPAEYLRLAREIEKALPESAARLAVLSTFTAELLKPFLIVECQRLNLWIISFHLLR